MRLKERFRHSTLQFEKKHPTIFDAKHRSAPLLSGETIMKFQRRNESCYESRSTDILDNMSHKFVWTDQLHLRRMRKARRLVISAVNI